MNPVSGSGLLRSKLTRYQAAGRIPNWGKSVVTSAQIMRFHMARFERRGYGSFRPPERFYFGCAQTLRSMMAALCVLVLAASTAAQDVNVHIQPREKTDPATQPKDNNKPSDNAPAPDGGFKVHGKPIQ